MRTFVHIWLQLGLLTIGGVFLSGSVQAQTNDTIRTIYFPVPYEDFSLYNFAGVRFKTDKTEIPPADLIKESFQPINSVFQKDSLYFNDSVQSVWFKFTIWNDYFYDTSIALVFLQAIHKASLYRKEGERLILIGKTGFFLAVLARTIPYEDNRIDIVLKAHSQTSYFIQIPRIGTKLIYSPIKTPVLESIAYAEMKAFEREKKVNRPGFLWSHFFTGLFFMFFVFGFIKYLVLGRDKAYLYYALMGLFNALLTVVHAEYPPLELPWFGNFRGVELFEVVNAAAILMQGLFILEILQLKIKYPRITRTVKWFLFLQLLIEVVYRGEWIITRQYHYIIWWLANPFIRFLILILMFSWVLYLATIRRGFYRFIFLGALTVFTAFTLLFIVRLLNLYYLFPGWFGEHRGGVNQFMQIALMVDMSFYFTGLAYRDRQVEKDKTIFQEQLIQQLKANEELQQKFTAELELQVKEKTTELIQQRQALEKEKEAKLLADFNRKLSESELKALRSQMNPHFVFNILNTIESYALQNNKEAASGMIQKFSRLARLVLENSMNQLVPFEQDFKALQLYIELEQMRYTEEFTTVYTIQEQVLEGEYCTPPMIIQPFVENAIVHGLRNKPDGERILHISADLKEEYLVVTVEDNGIGRAEAVKFKVNNPLHKVSAGVKLTQDRISIFNNLTTEKKARAEIDDLSEGTRVTIWLPQVIK